MMKIIPTNKQKEAFMAVENHFITIYGGAIRGGKSYWGGLVIVSFCFKYTNSRWLMLRESLPTLKRTLLVTFQKLLDTGLKDYVKEFNQQTLTLTWNNGSQIIFMAESYATDKELNRFRGLEINGAFIDEVNEIQEVTFDKIIERSGAWFGSKNCPSKIIASCNPTNSWVKDRFYKPFQKNDLPKNVSFIKAKITDNPHVPKDYLETLKTLPRYEYEVFVNGNWDLQLKTGGEFYKSFELHKHVVVCFYNPKLALHVSFDDNVNPYLPCGIFQIDGKNIYMIDEIAFSSPKNNVREVCSEIIRRYKGHDAGMFVYGDATAQKADTKLEFGSNFFSLVLQELLEFKPVKRVLSANPSVVMRGNWINSILERQNGGISFFINEKNTNAINDFVMLKEASDGTKHKQMETDNKTKVRYQKYGHFSDLVDYLLCRAFVDEFNKFKNGDDIFDFSFLENVKVDEDIFY